MNKHFLLPLVAPNLLLAFAFFCSVSSLQAQWKAYTPALSETVGAFDLRIAQGTDQVAWCVAMKYDVTPTAYTWVPSDSLFFTKTADGGDTWSAGAIPMGAEPYASNICPISSTTAWASGTDVDFVSYVLRTDDGGATWKRQLEDGFTGATSYVDFVHFWDEQNGLAVGDPAPSATEPDPFYEIYTTSDGGLTWSRVPSTNIPPPIADEYGSAALYEVRGDYVWFVTIDVTTGTGKRLFRTKDRGQTWEVLSAADNRINLFSFADTLHGLGAKRISPTKEQLFFTADGGDTWTELPTFLSSIPATSYVLIPGSNFILVTRRVNNVTGPFRTTLSKDLGKTWIELSTGTGENVGTVHFNSATLGYGGEWQPTGHATRMYKYAGSPLTGLLSGLALDARVTLSPNPTADQVNVEIEVAEPAEFLLLFHDAQGRLIERRFLEKTSVGNARFDLSHLPAGVYTLSVSSQRGYLTRAISKI